jgi:hypothetical protein
MAYVDNTTAEAVAENGRTSTEMLSELNKRRLLQLTDRGVFETNERVTSVDNDVADLISRGDIAEALRFPQVSLGLRVFGSSGLRAFGALGALGLWVAFFKKNPQTMGEVCLLLALATPTRSPAAAC